MTEVVPFLSLLRFISISDTGPWWFNLLMALFTEMRYPLSFAVREVNWKFTDHLQLNCRRLSTIVAGCSVFQYNYTLSKLILITLKVLQSETDFLSATKRLSSIPLMAPCYLIVSGTKAGEGVVITRNRISTADIWYLEPYKDQ